MMRNATFLLIIGIALLASAPLAANGLVGPTCTMVSSSECGDFVSYSAAADGAHLHLEASWTSGLLTLSFSDGDTLLQAEVYDITALEGAVASVTLANGHDTLSVDLTSDEIASGNLQRLSELGAAMDQGSARRLRELLIGVQPTGARLAEARAIATFVVIVDARGFAKLRPFDDIFWTICYWACRTGGEDHDYCSGLCDGQYPR